MKLRQVKPKNLLRALQKVGFVIKRQKGSHIFLEKRYQGKVLVTSIAIHNTPIPKGTLKAILKQTGLSEDELIKLLR